jgi:hypothetical protein
MGDPQAPFEQVLRVLDAHGLLDGGGRLRADTWLVSLGDHFDYGSPAQRARATLDGEQLLAWLASHPPEQVAILAGNHDLARLGELAPFTEETFELARAEAAALYAQHPPDAARVAAFLSRTPSVPDVECLARDFSCFAPPQRMLVSELLDTGRLQLATSAEGLLFQHAGVTLDDLAAAGLTATTAEETAAQLEAWFEARLAGWRTTGVLDLHPLHQSGSAATGEGRGIFFHRPADPAHDEPARFEGPPRRRFDPRRLPDFGQVVGHIRDGKCRELMPDWHDGAPAADGPLRALWLEQGQPRYGFALPHDARLFFVDNGMSQVPPERYQLFDVSRRARLLPLPR